LAFTLMVVSRASSEDGRGEGAPGFRPSVYPLSLETCGLAPTDVSLEPMVRLPLPSSKGVEGAKIAAPWRKKP
jgi:hypothetical protein